MVVVMFSMEIFVVEIRKMIRKRQEMNFVGKQIRVFNAGTIMYIIQSSSITARHSFMVLTRKRSLFVVGRSTRDNAWASCAQQKTQLPLLVVQANDVKSVFEVAWYMTKERL